jgi:hypothetical protein
MSTINATICGESANRQLSGEFQNDGAYQYKKLKETIIEFRLYPVPSFTGVCKNGIYEKALEAHVSRFLGKRFKAFNYRIGRIRECHDMCPDGYKCRYLEIPVRFKGSWKGKNEAIWFCEYNNY